MKQQMNKIIDFIKKNKVSSLVLGCFILVCMFILVGRSLADPNTGYLRNQVVDGLSFENADLVYENGISTFTVEIFNENEEVYSLRNISINFTDESGDVVTLVGYIGDTLEVNEEKIITASIDADLSNSTALEYVINK